MKNLKFLLAALLALGLVACGEKKEEAAAPAEQPAAEAQAAPAEKPGESGFAETPIGEEKVVGP